MSYSNTLTGTAAVGTFGQNGYTPAVNGIGTEIGKLKTQIADALKLATTTKSETTRAEQQLKIMSAATQLANYNDPLKKADRAMNTGPLAG
jgi:hypothetical protein